MDWKIEDIQKRNFKYAHNLFSIHVGQKNMLLYGENGCGKSTIYWALYTLYQSYFKENEAAVAKYFDESNDQNLLNRYDTDASQFLVKVVYKNETDVEKELELSPVNMTVVRSGDTFVQNTATFSDFINYKTLSSFFDFRNSAEANIFPFVEKELFPLLDLGDKCTGIDGTETVTSYAAEWWNYIRENAIAALPVKDGWIDAESVEYHRYQGIIEEFNARLRDKLLQLQEDTNQVLNDKFRIRDTSIEFEYADADFNLSIPRHPELTDERLHDPKILIRVKVDRDIIPLERNKRIVHPKTFFNEAQLTRIAFAIRLALFEERSVATIPDSNALLCLDDVLISLDMANRLQIIDLLLAYAENYQMIVMTHDRSFYNLLKMEIARKCQNGKWVYKQMYIPEGTGEYANIPEPVLLDEKNNMQKAEEFIRNYDYAAAANCLRKECESILCDLYFSNQILRDNSDGTRQKRELNDLMQRLPGFFAQYGLPDLAPHLNSYRKLILNPMSHADLDTAFFRNELQACIGEITALKGLTKTLLFENEIDAKEPFWMTVTQGGTTCVVEFVFNEQMACINYAGAVYYYDPKVCVHSVSMPIRGISTGMEYCIKAVLAKVCTDLGMTGIPALDAVVTHKASGRTL